MISKRQERNENNVNYNIVALILIIVILIRLLLTLLPSDKIDMPVHLGYTHYMEENGIASFYNDTKTVYGPVFMYILLFVSKVSGLFSINNEGREFFIKVFPVIADFVAAFMIYLIGKRVKKQRLGMGLAVFYVLNPAMIMNSSVWGQFDSIYATLLFATVFFFSIQRQEIAVVFYTIAVLTKPQSILLLPLVIYSFFLQGLDVKAALSFDDDNKTMIRDFFVRKQYFMRIILGTLYSVIAYSLINLPFYIASSNLKGPISMIIDFITWFPRNTFRAVNDYPYATANGFNLWTLFGGQTVNDSSNFLLLTYSSWSKILILCLWCFALLMLINCKNKIYGMYFTSYILAFGFFMFTTRAHERYMLPTIVFCTVCILWNKRFWMYAIPISLCIFTNVYIVYKAIETGYPWISVNNDVSLLVALVCIIVFVLSFQHGIKYLKRKNPTQR